MSLNVRSQMMEEAAKHHFEEDRLCWKPWPAVKGRESLGSQRD